MSRNSPQAACLFHRRLHENESPGPAGAFVIPLSSERRPELLHKYPWPARSPNGRVNMASMLDMQDWYVANKLSTAKLPPEKLLDLSYADYANKKLGPFALANKDSKTPGCRE